MPLMTIAGRNRYPGGNKSTQVLTGTRVLHEIDQGIDGPALVAGIKIQTGNSIEQAIFRSEYVLATYRAEVVGVCGSTKAKIAAAVIGNTLRCRTIDRNLSLVLC